MTPNGHYPCYTNNNLYHCLIVCNAEKKVNVVVALFFIYIIYIMIYFLLFLYICHHCGLLFF